MADAQPYTSLSRLGQHNREHGGARCVEFERRPARDEATSRCLEPTLSLPEATASNGGCLLGRDSDLPVALAEVASVTNRPSSNFGSSSQQSRPGSHSQSDRPRSNCALGERCPPKLWPSLPPASLFTSWEGLPRLQGNLVLGHLQLIVDSWTLHSVPFRLRRDSGLDLPYNLHIMLAANSAVPTGWTRT